jgi:Flp pilus assembly protein CpaB
VAPEPAIEGDMVDVVIADADLAQGSLLARKQLAVRRLPKQFATASHVSRRFIDDVVDTSLTVPMQRGDLLMWQMLDDPAAPRSPMTCVAGAVAARLAARQKVATEGAAAFVQKKAAP